MNTYFRLWNYSFQMANRLSKGLTHMYKYKHDALTKQGTPSVALNYPYIVILFQSVCCGCLETDFLLRTTVWHRYIAWKSSTINILEDCLSYTS